MNILLFSGDIWLSTVSTGPTTTTKDIFKTLVFTNCVDCLLNPIKTLVFRQFKLKS